MSALLFKITITALEAFGIWQMITKIGQPRKPYEAREVAIGTFLCSGILIWMWVAL